MTGRQISLNDIYIVVNRLEDKMDGRMKDIEKDVEDLQNANAKMVGIFSAVSIFTGSIASFIWEKVFKN